MPNKRTRKRNKKRKRQIQINKIKQSENEGITTTQIENKTKKESVKKPKIKKWNDESSKQGSRYSEKETFQIQKATGKYICSITEIKTLKKNNESQQNIKIKNVSKRNSNSKMLQPSPISDHTSFSSKNPDSENSKNLSEMSLILTPMQVKLKQEKFSKSTQKIGSIRSKFGSFRQTGRLESCDDEIIQKHNNPKTGFHKMKTKFSGDSNDKQECLTERTDLSKSENMFEMFQTLSIRSGEDQNQVRESFKGGNSPLKIYSQESQSARGSETFENKQKCFLDIGDAQHNFATPFVKGDSENGKKLIESSSFGQTHQSTWEAPKMSLKSDLTASEAQDSLELSCEQRWGLMEMIGNTLLHSDKIKRKPTPNLATFQGLVFPYIPITLDSKFN